jgi:EamA domain-containing membrane protein RarD
MSLLPVMYEVARKVDPPDILATDPWRIIWVATLCLFLFAWWREWVAIRAEGPKG